MFCELDSNVLTMHAVPRDTGGVSPSEATPAAPLTAGKRLSVLSAAPGRGPAAVGAWV